MRGTKLVPAMGRMFGTEADLRARNAALASAVVIDRAAIERRGQRCKSLGTLLQLPLFRAASMPKSSKKEKVTGPAMGMRYSALVMRLVSPPMEAMPYTGSGT